VIDFRLYLVGDRNQCAGRSLSDAILQAARAGVRAVQVREKDLSSIDLYELAVEIRDVLADFPCSVLINDRSDIAIAAGLSGVHLPESGMKVEIVRGILPTGSCIGVSTHSLAGAHRAISNGADFITFGPIFQTPSKVVYGPPLGIEALREVCLDMNIPVFALGGIKPQNTQQCLDAGAHGVGVISAILSASNIEKAVVDFQHVLGKL